MSYISNIVDSLIFLKALKKYIANCYRNLSAYDSSFQKDLNGRYISFSSNVLNLNRFQNIELVLWNHHTNNYFHDKFIYLNRSQEYQNQILEEDRLYTLLIGPLDIKNINSNQSLIDDLYQGLFYGDYAYMIFHEITHLNNAKSISTKELCRLHHNYLQHARTKQSVERFPQIAFSLGILSKYAGKHRNIFKSDFSTVDIFVNAIMPPEKEIIPEKIINKIKIKEQNLNEIKNKLATVWNFVISGGIEIY